MNTIINLHNIKFFNPQQIPIPQTQLHQRAKTNRTTHNFLANLEKQPHNTLKNTLTKLGVLVVTISRFLVFKYDEGNCKIIVTTQRPW